MKKNIITALAVLCSSLATLGMSKPASAQFGQSSIGPSLEFGNGQSAIGIDSKFGVSDNLSLRPFIYFPSGRTDFGTALTYDFQLRNSASDLRITPFVGGSLDFNTGSGNSITTVGLVGGADLDLTDSIRLKAAVIVPLTTDRGQTTTVTIGAGYRF
jgi:opacity protein-like surface antigen